MSTKFSRNQFIGSIFIVVAGGLAYYWGTSNRPAPEAYLAGEYLTRDQKPAGRIVLLTTQADIKKRWTLSFPAHSVSHNNAIPWMTCAVEENGQSLSVVDLRSHRKPEVTNPPENLVFSGHSLFSSDGMKLFVTAYDKSSFDGFILTYETETFQLMEKQSSGGKYPHELQYDNKDLSSIIVANAGGPDSISNLTWIKDQKIAKFVVSESGTGSIKGFLQTIDGDIYLYGHKTLGHFRRDFKTVKLADWPATKQGEVLNAYHDPVKLKLWITMPSEDSVLIVDGRSLKVEKEFKAEKPGSVLAVTPTRPDLLMVSVSLQKDGSGQQRSYNLNTLSGSDEAVDRPRKFYSVHVTPLEVSVQDQ